MLRSFPVTSHLLRALAGTVFAAWTLASHADPGQVSTPEQPNRRDRKVLSETYGGVVVNQTITVAGQNFYQCFVASWRDKEMSERYAISIHERPSARWGTQVWIEYAQKRVFQAFLPSSIANIKALSEQAAEVAQQKVVDVEVDRLLFREAEFGPDEF
jgi:curli production assembly/transport component CsgE